MAYSISNKCAKNLCKWTVLVQLIVENVVRFLFWNSVDVLHKFGLKLDCSDYLQFSGLVRLAPLCATTGSGHCREFWWGRYAYCTVSYERKQQLYKAYKNSNKALKSTSSLQHTYTTFAYCIVTPTVINMVAQHLSRLRSQYGVKSALGQI